MNNQIPMLSTSPNSSRATRQAGHLTLPRRRLPRKRSGATDHIDWDRLPNDLILPTEAKDTLRLGWSGFIAMQSLMVQGTPFDEMHVAGQKQPPFLLDVIPSALSFMQIWQSFATRLTVEAEADFLVDNEVAELDLMASLNAMSVKSPLSWHYILQSQASYLLGNHIEAAKTMCTAEYIIDSSYGQTQLVEQCFYHSLIIAAIYPNVTASAQHYYWNKLVNHLKIMKQSAQRSPEDFEDKYLLVAAEMARLIGDDKEASDLYQAALIAAHKHGFIQNEALAHELLARFLLAKGEGDMAQIHLTLALQGYDLWGASRKVNDIQRVYAQWLCNSQAEVSHHQFFSHQIPSQPLDFATTFHAYQAISEEMGLGWFLEEVTHLLLGVSHAERAIIILQDDEQWLIEAEGKAGSKSTKVLQSLPINDTQASPLSTTLVEAVIREKETIILNHDISNTPFSDDPYLRQTKPTATLCLPLLYRGQLQCIIYLETQQSKATFTQKRVELLKFLGWQVACSLERVCERG